MNAAEQLTKCKCLKCGENIEFDLEEFQPSGESGAFTMGQAIDCPHCGRQTLLSVLNLSGSIRGALPPGVRPQQIRRSFSWRTFTVLGIVAVLVAVGIGALVKNDQLANALGIGGGLLYLVVLAFAAVLALLWIFFPFFVYFALGRQEELLKQIERNTRRE